MLGFVRTRMVAAFSHYNRGREPQPGAGIYSYGGDVAAGVVLPLLNQGVINQRQIVSKTGTLRVFQSPPRSRLPASLGEIVTVGNIANPVSTNGS